MGATDGNLRKVQRNVEESIANIWSRNFFYKLLRVTDPVDDIAKAICDGQTKHQLDILEVPKYDRTIERHNKKEKGKLVQYGYYTWRSEEKTKEKIDKMLANEKNKNKSLCEIEDAWSAQQYLDHKEVVIDYQTALNEEGGDAAGRVDLLLLVRDKDENKLLFGEVKKKDSAEPLLRAILEVNTYRELCKAEELIQNYCEKSPRLKDTIVNPKEILKAIIVFEFEFEETNRGKKESLFTQLKLSKYRNVQELMRKLKVYAIKAEALEEGIIEYYEGFGPSDY